MNYYGPRELYERDEDGERQPTGTYHYTHKQGSGSRARVWPIGYCRGDLVTTREEYDERYGANSPAEQYEEGWDSDRRGVEDAERTLRVNRKLMEEFGDKFHSHGHESEEQAKACYTEYCLDVKLTFWHQESTEFRRYFGLHPDDLSEPVTGDDVPADVQGKECRYDGCETIIAYPTAAIGTAGGGGPHRMHLCREHCNRGSIEEFYSVGTAFGTL